MDTLIELFRKPRVMAVSGTSHSKLYGDIAAGLFPKPVKHNKTSLWPANEVAAINAARIAGKSNDQIRALVSDLHAKRKQAA